jgi:Family of unknown function (DUF5990)
MSRAALASTTGLSERRVKIRLICPDTIEATVAEGGFDFGLQDVDQVVHPGKGTQADSVQFECDLRIKLDGAKKTIHFYGAFVHGPSADRFLYWSWKRQNPTDSLWIRRLKIPLSEITWKQVSGLKEGQVLQGRISADRKGARAMVDWAVV